MSVGDEPAGHCSSDCKHLYLIYGLVVLYAFCYQLQLPLEPFLVDQIVGKGIASKTAYGRLQSFFQVVQTIGSFAFGGLLDHFGVKIGLIVNFIATALSYLLLANSTNLTILFLSKVPGVAAAGFLCAQTAVSQLTPNGEARVVALGRLTTAYTIGGVLGPSIGGFLGSKGDYFLSARIAVFGSLVAAALCFFLPGGLVGTREEDAAREGQAEASADCERHAQLPRWHRRAKVILVATGALLLAKLTTSTANSMASSTQSLILKDELSFSESDLGMFMSCQFAFGGIANGFLLAPLTRVLGGQVRSVVANAVAMMTLGYFALAALRAYSTVGGVVGSVINEGPAQTLLFIGIAMGLSVFQYGLSTTVTAESTKRVPKDMKGTLIGMEHGIFAAARILTPSIGVTILTAAGSSALYGTVACIFATVFVLWKAFADRFLPREEHSTEKKAG